MISRIVLVLALWGFCFKLQGFEQIHAHFENDADVLVDGDLNETVWRKASVIKVGYEVWPANAVPVPRQFETLAKVFVDGDAIYFAIWAKDPNPNEIVASYFKRDAVEDDDHVSIRIDSSGSGEKAYIFNVNPLGGQEDYILHKREELDWDGHWESAGRVTAEGYQVEIKIPIKNFRFKEKETLQWKLGIYRELIRETRRQYSNVAIDRNIDCKICQYQEIKFSNKTSQATNVQIRPSVYSAESKSRDYPYEGNYTPLDDSQVGLELRWSPGREHVLNGTLNPDFSHVEADSIETQLNRLYSVFIEEKRPFFLEGREYFTSPINLVNTRLIFQPSFGMKYTGTVDDILIGAFATDDSETSLYLPSLQSNEFLNSDQDSHNIAAKISKDFGAGNQIGVLYTGRRADNYRNQVASFDGYFRPTDTIRLAFQVASSTDKLDNIENTGTAVYTSYNYNSENNYHWLSYKELDSGFRSGLGYVTSVGNNTYGAGIGHVWHNNSEDALWESIYLTSSTSHVSENQTGNSLYRQSDVELQFIGTTGLEITYKPALIIESYNNREFRFHRNYFNAYYRFSKEFVVDYWKEFGDEIDYHATELAKLDRWGLQVDTQIGRALKLSAEYIVNSLDDKLRYAPIFEEKIVNFTSKFSLDFSNHFRLTVQTYSHQSFPLVNEDPQIEKENTFAYQFLYLFQPSTHTSIYIGYSTDNYKDNGFQDYRTVKENYFAKMSTMLEFF